MPKMCRSCCATASCGTICVTATGCSGALKRSGALVTLHGVSTTSATATATRTGTVITSLSLTGGGTGYTTTPAVLISGGGATTSATATATISGGAVTAITLTDGGAGYTGTPTVSFLGGGALLGSCTTATSVTQLVVTNHGTGYTSVPTVSFTGGGGSGAAATATLSGTTVGTVTLTAGGTGYTSAPTVSFTGGGGSNAAVVANINSLCCVPYTTAATYAATVTQSGYLDRTTLVTPVGCTGAVAVSTSSQNPSIAQVTVTTASYCNGQAIAGVTVTAKISGSPVASGTSNSSGVVTLSVPAAPSVTFSGASTRTAFTDVAIQVFDCASSDFIYTGSGTVSGYACLVASCDVPLATSLSLTDAILGGYSLTWYAAGTPTPDGITFGIPGWYGSKTVSYPGRVVSTHYTGAAISGKTVTSVVVSGGGGSGATATWTGAGDMTITDGGTGYTGKPIFTVTFSDGSVAVYDPNALGTVLTATFCPAAASVLTAWFLQGNGATHGAPSLTFYASSSCPCHFGDAGCPALSPGAAGGATAFSCPESGATLLQFAVGNPINSWYSTLYGPSTQTIAE